MKEKVDQPSRRKSQNFPKPGKISGNCQKGKCNVCFSLSCSHHCHSTNVTISHVTKDRN